MIIDRYIHPANFPDCQTTDPILQELDWILDDPVLFDLVRCDFAKHYKPSRKGRRPIAIEVILRMTILRRRKKWPYRQAEQEVRDSPTYQGWVRVYNEPVPDHTTLNDLERVIQANTLHRINDRIVTLAQAHRLTQGYRLRVDSSVTESNIHHPTDSGLLFDGVRLLGRWLKRARPLLPARYDGARLCQGHGRSARRRMRRLRARRGRAKPGSGPRSGARSKKAVNRAYSELLAIARAAVTQSRMVTEALSESSATSTQRLRQQFDEVIPLVEQVIAQTERRVLQGESVPAAESPESG